MTASIPLQWVGPITLIRDGVRHDVEVPLATFESPLWPSVERGARACNRAGGIQIALLRDTMTRSILLEAPDALTAATVTQQLLSRKTDIASQITATSRHLTFQDIHIANAGNLLFIRLAAQPGNASGHNMLTVAAERMLTWVVESYPQLTYVSISGNYCTDKKVSAVNSILGRGKAVIAEAILPRAICTRYLKTTPEAITSLNIKKNLLGSILAGSLISANAHYANMLLASYLATGQDAANIVEGSQGITYATATNDSLAFSVTLPNLIVGTVGNGKELPWVQENLARMQCRDGQQLAAIIAATVLCGELSLLATQTQQGALVASHIKLERKKHV